MQPFAMGSNPMRLELCRRIPWTLADIGACGHPGCSRAAEWVGLNRVCDFCAAGDPTNDHADGDPDCELFHCSRCLVLTNPSQ